ncbi:DUF1036 domain-containing protein [Falsiroseomonas sp. E2-1-a4]|uniref:DUF1036 domain-containing protein n=1 Tax=Falsiroseomonas sp. E2-1-a4 TaxID=3239299 RepID=UPI003F2DF788
MASTSGLMLAAPGPAHAQTEIARDIWFHNACNRPVRLLVRHAEETRQWRSRGWWNFGPMEPPRALSSRGNRIQHLSNHRLYYYAETVDGSVIWEGDGRNTTRVSGVTYRLRQASPTVVRGRLQVRLTCTGAGGGGTGGGVTGGGGGAMGPPKN